MDGERIIKSLQELVPVYGQNKGVLDSTKKICEKQSAEIKDLMQAANLDSCEIGGYKVTCSVSQREKMNEEKLVDFLTRRGLTQFIYLRPCVDTDKLEQAMYSNEIDKQTRIDMNSCKTVTEVVTLRVAKQKQKKMEEK